MKRFPPRPISTSCSSLLAACITFVVVDPAPAGPTQPATDHSWDIAVIDRALASAKPADPWVKFGDVGIKYADLKTYRDRLAASDQKSPGPQPLVVTPAGTAFKWPGGNVNFRLDPIGLTNGTVYKMTTAGAITPLHTFTGSDGANPVAGLVRATDGNLYGTTQIGGTSNNGTVFKITTGGTFTTLYNFSGTDGSSPSAGLVQGTDGNFYGTTQIGGTNNTGTIFKITSAGVLTTLYSFSASGSDGMNPVASLIQAAAPDGNLYGVTQYGGTNNAGTVFKISSAGVFTSIHSFNVSDGYQPVAQLVQAAAPDLNFYGVTQYGGTNNAGTVFKITSAGTLTTIHSFNFNDGYQPVAGLIQAAAPDLNFYGTTQLGGASSQGTVFKVTATGTVTTLHSFVLNDGQQPVASLVQAAAPDLNFYGTVFRGGTNADGTTFKVTSAGAFTPLHTFLGTDGTEPMAGLIQGAGADTNFYGTTPGNNSITTPKQQQFRDGVGEWAAFANLHFIEFTTGVPPTNFITVQEKPAGQGEGGFSSSVGMAGGEQFVRIGAHSWNRGTVCHEVGHALGLWHEQQRPDRDTYVIINSNNINPGDQGNFAIINNGQTFSTAYDFFSVMHYSRKALSNDGQDTISMQPAYAQYIDIIGSVYDRTLSKIERAGMAAIYGNPSPLPSALVTNTNDSGPGSMRSAIYFAFDRSTDAVPTPTTVTFNIPTTDSNFSGGVFTIKPTYLMTSPGDGTTIDGTTQTAFTGDTNPTGPEIILDGSAQAQYEVIGGVFGPAFILRQANCTIKGFVIHGYDNQGIQITNSVPLGSVAAGNVISGCFIGTDKAGSAGIANTFPGIEIFGGAHNNTIGGTTAAARNVVSGNAHHGISIHDAGTANNLIVGNYIGTTADGTGPLANTFTGIAIFGGAQNNTIGGTSTSARNVIAGNKNQGVLIADPGTNGNAILGNYIGLNAAGTAAVRNGFQNLATDSFYPGVGIFNGAQNNLVGGTAAGSSNVISGNAGQGVSISGTGTNNNFVQGNFIGTDPAGSSAIGNGFADPPKFFLFQGVAIFGGAQSNIVGGTTAASANLISGNAGYGLIISDAGSSANLVQGNSIGTNAAGAGAIANGYAGVGIRNGAASNTIGGTSTSARNVLSGNTNQGVVLADAGTNNNSVQGNFIGVNAGGNGALPNAYAGISLFLGAQTNTIGGTAPGARNIISGNSQQGLTISDSGTNSNMIQGNYIGLDVTGIAKVANTSTGIDIFGGAQSNVIGGTAAGARNFICGSTFYGVALSGINTNSNLIQGNTIGLNVAGSVVANGSQGVALFQAQPGDLFGPQLNFIGGTAVGASNIIAGNTNEAIAMFNSGTIHNTISENSIFSNGGGISLNSGSNSSQVAPTLNSAALSTATNQNGTDVSVNMSGSASTTFRIEFFATPAGGNQGQFFLGSASVNGGTMNLVVPLTAVVPSGFGVTATATAPNGNTSAFSPAVTVPPPTDSDSDGIPDNWMNLHFGHPTGQASDNSRAGDDADGTGMTNLQKFLAGLDPKNPNSVFRISSISMNAGSIQIGFPSVTAKTYQLQYRDDLVAGNWNILLDQIFGTGTTMQITDPTAAAASKRFYRLSLEP